MNRGAEAMTLMPGGGMIVIGETEPWPGGKGRAGIRFSGDPTQAPRAGFRFSYMPPKGYDPSDMAVLPDGDLMILNRRFVFPFNFTAKLTIVDSAAIRPGALVQGREIATFAAPLLHDNFEGLAITREGPATIVWIVSDDNQSFLQRSLLLKFRLDPDLPAATLSSRAAGHRRRTKTPRRPLSASATALASNRKPDQAAAEAPSFLATSRFRRRARSDSLSLLVLTSQLSSPPTCSTERRPCVETRSFTLVPRASDISVTFCRFGRKVRLVLLLAWETLFPTSRPLPVSSQMRDMVLS